MNFQDEDIKRIWALLNAPLYFKEIREHDLSVIESAPIRRAQSNKHQTQQNLLIPNVKPISKIINLKNLENG